MNRKILICLNLALGLIMSGCGNKSSKNGLTDNLEDNSAEYLNSDVNAIEQAKPEIMVLPSDGVLQKFGAADQTSDGVVRDYQKYLLADKNNRAAISALQEQFITNNYPLNDFEQTLKQLATRSATDDAEDLARVPKHYCWKLPLPTLS